MRGGHMPLLGKKKSKVYAAEEPELVLDEEIELPATPRDNAPDAGLRTVLSGELLEPEPEPEQLPQPQHLPEPEAEPEPEPDKEPDKELWRGDMDTVKSEKKGTIKWHKKYAIVWSSLSAASWTPRMEIFANLKAAKKGLCESVVPLAGVTMEQEPEDKFNTVQLAFKRADGTTVRVRMDDKNDASAPFQDAVLKALVRPEPIPEDGEFVPDNASSTSTPRSSRTAELKSILVNQRTPPGSLGSATPPLTARSGGSAAGSVSSTTSSLWQVYIEEDAATQIQRIARGRMVRQDMYEVEVELAIEVDEEEQEATRLALEAEQEAAQLALEAEKEAAAQAREELRWAELRAQFKKGTHARTEDDAVGVVTREAEGTGSNHRARQVELRLVSGGVRDGIMLDTLTQLTPAEVAELDDEEARMDREFLAQEKKNNQTIEAWTGMTRRSATYMIQSYARGWIARRTLQKRTTAAVVIQSVVRGRQCRLQLHEEATREARTQAAMVAIQATFRGYRIRRILRIQLSRVLRVQGVWRGRKCRAELHKAKIEELSKQLLRKIANGAALAAFQRWAEWTAETIRLRDIGNRMMRRMLKASVYQAFTRWCEYTADLKDEKDAAITHLQAVARGWLRRRALARHLAGMLLLQSAVRGAVGRAEVLLLHRSATRIQALSRGWSVRRRVAMWHRNATVIQRMWRGHLARSELRARHSAATTIQAVERGVQARRKHRAKHALALTIQRIWRGFSCRLLLARWHAAALLIQTAARGWLARLRYRAATRRICHVQKVWRGRAQRRALAEMHAAAARMQAIERGRQERKMQLVRQACARTVQGRMRDWIARKRRHRAAAVMIQKVWRGWQCRSRLAREHLLQCAVMIQKMWRGKLMQRIFNGIREAAITLECIIRTHNQARWYRETKAATNLQAAWRGRLSRRFYQNWLSMKRVERRGDEAFQKKWFEEAVRDYSDADKLGRGEHYHLKCKRAAALTALGMYDEAVKDCDRCIQRKATYAPAYRRKGTALYAQGMFAEAEACYRECLRLDESDAEAERLLARLQTVLELRKRAKGDRSSQLPRSALLLERAKLLSDNMERAYTKPTIIRPREVPREVERMQRAARYHEKLTDRGRSLWLVEVDSQGHYTTVKRPKSRPSFGEGGGPDLDGGRSVLEPPPAAEVLRLPPIGSPAVAAAATATAGA